MKKSDYTDIIKLVSAPDTIVEGLEQLNTMLDKHEKEYNDLNDNINKLRDTNSRLALRITAPVMEEQQIELTPEQKANDIIENIKNDLGGIKDGITN